jgi:hypothetical protein
MERRYDGAARGVEPDYIALQEPERSMEEVVAYARQLHPGATYEPFGSASGYYVVKRR